MTDAGDIKKKKGKHKVKKKNIEKNTNNLNAPQPY